ncbi:hypothetical protein JYK17_17420 [Streptomyces sp. KC 17012]|jgi:hypothetical protein|uniref:hypothetical protein n=1 Tax=Streptomyces plumbidurans TaxID=2814589 RepID=UPI001C9D80FC|nr:hypothetical protein [Streptomyces plumbidurans]MBY8341812.1 hypothetical protein [Streptomyces plumbidurans]
MARHALPSGHWVELRDPATLRRGDKKRALRMVPIAEDIDLTLGTPVEMADGTISVMITAWSYEYPLPVTAATLDLLPLEDGNALEELPEIQEAHKLLHPDQPAATPEQVADETSPTEASAG